MPMSSYMSHDLGWRLECGFLDLRDESEVVFISRSVDSLGVAIPYSMHHQCSRLGSFCKHAFCTVKVAVRTCRNMFLIAGWVHFQQDVICKVYSFFAQD